MTKRRKILLLIAFLSIFCFLLFTFPPISSSPKVIAILYWTPMFGQKNFNLGLGAKIFENCTYTNCFTTSDRTHFASHSEFDAILFHGIEYRQATFGVPLNRSLKQIYIYSNQESPIYTPQQSEVFDNFYNWTMTYRLDSDIVRPYGFVKPQKTKYILPKVEKISRKKKLIAWFVSNCGTASKREVLFQQISKELPVDVYGSCGNLSCPKDTTQDCYKLIENNYKFYLSFENSVCNDYVTEKLYNVLKLNVIPIVFSGADYNKLAPPNSVINVKNFTSIKEFVERIRFLDKNPKEYLKYFEWKQKYVIDTSSETTLCELCRKLNEDRNKTKIYRNITQWWLGDVVPQCVYNFYKKFF